MMSRIEQNYYRTPIFTLDEDTFFRHGQCEQKIPDYEAQYIRRIDYITDGRYLRAEVAAYDAAGDLLNESDSLHATNSIWDSEDKKQKFGDNVGNMEFAVTSAYAKIFGYILQPEIVLDTDRFKRITIYIEVRREHINYATTIKNKLPLLKYTTT